MDSQQGGDSAKAVKKGFEDYTGDIAYEEGKSGKGIRLGDYGLKLNKTNLGEEYTVSMWLKPDGTFDENQCLAFLGYHNPENWISLSGSKTESLEAIPHYLALLSSPAPGSSLR